MTKPTIPIESYVEASRVFHWASMRHYQLWFTGQAAKRHRRSETVLNKLVKKGKLRAIRYGSKLIYNSRRVKDEFLVVPKVPHGLACTEALVRIWRSRMEGVVVPEKYFTHFGAVPEWGIIYPNHTILLFEYCSKTDFHYTGKINTKLSNYERWAERIGESFKAKPIVLFLIDEKRDLVKEFAKGHEYYFCDWYTFVQNNLSKADTAPIYFWSDWENQPLRHV